MAQYVKNDNTTSKFIKTICFTICFINNFIDFFYIFLYHYSVIKIKLINKI